MKNKLPKDNEKRKALMPSVNAHGVKLMSMTKTRGQSSSPNKSIKKKKTKASSISKGKKKLHDDRIPLTMKDLVAPTSPYIASFFSSPEKSVDASESLLKAWLLMFL